jgi:hypothetical protein
MTVMLMVSRIISAAFVVLIMTFLLLPLLLIYPLQDHNNNTPVLVAFADHGEEISIILYDNSTFMPLTSGAGNQVSVFATYEINDDSIIGQPINALMEVYAQNGTLIRTSSYPNGFIVQSPGGIEGVETTIKDPTIQSVTANLTFTNAEKTEILSNPLTVDLTLEGGGDTTTTTATPTTPTEAAEEQQQEEETAEDISLPIPSLEEDGEDEGEGNGDDADEEP